MTISLKPDLSFAIYIWWLPYTGRLRLTFASANQIEAYKKIRYNYNRLYMWTKPYLFARHFGFNSASSSSNLEQRETRCAFFTKPRYKIFSICYVRITCLSMSFKRRYEVKYFIKSSFFRMFDNIYLYYYRSRKTKSHDVSDHEKVKNARLLTENTLFCHFSRISVSSYRTS